MCDVQSRLSNCSSGGNPAEEPDVPSSVAYWHMQDW